MPEFVNPFVGMVPQRKLSKGELLRGLRLSLAAEEEATHIYQSLADATDDVLAKAVLNDIANEERVHKGEFHRLIALLAPDEDALMAEGSREVNEIRDGLGMISAEGKNDVVVTVGDLRSKKERG